MLDEPAPKMPDFSQIMGHLADVIVFIRVSERSLDHLEVAPEEQSLLRMGLPLWMRFIRRSTSHPSRSSSVRPLERDDKSRTTGATIYPTRCERVRRCIETSLTTPNADVRCCKSSVESKRPRHNAEANYRSGTSPPSTSIDRAQTPIQCRLCD